MYSRCIHVETNLVHKLHHVRSFGFMELESSKTSLPLTNTPSVLRKVVGKVGILLPYKVGI